MRFTDKRKGMTGVSRPVWLAFVLAAVSLTPSAAQGNTEGSTSDVGLNMTDLKWQPAPSNLPAGTQIVVLQGDSSRAGGVTTIRLRFPAGAVVPPHLHSTDEAATVISGRFHVAPGDVLDKTRGITLTGGGFTTLMAGHHHFAWVDGVTVVQFSGLGPLDIKYLNPADDPSFRK